MIGIVSDSHDNLESINMAIKFLKKKNIELLLHAGDIISPFAAVRFKELGCEIIAVFGNNDGERKVLREKINKISDFAEFTYRGKKFAVYHGSIDAITRSLVKSGLYDFVITGHTHKAKIEVVGKTMHINPGELCGYLNGKRTLCLLDLENMKAKIEEI